MAPVELELVVAGEGVDDGDDARLGPAAHKIEVEHALDGSGLHAPHDRLGFHREHGTLVGARVALQFPSQLRHLALKPLVGP